ncbi:MAG: hypothetical protein AAGC93_29930 [Cyanobacteria bacterium P01_F01_bin.53]
MAQKRIAALINQEVQQPDGQPENNIAETSSEIAITQNTPLAELQLTSQGLFDESKALWEEFVAFDQEHQIAQKVGAQLWRVTKAVGKPALILSLKGIQTAIVTVADADKRAALVERFSRSEAAQTAEASLEPTEE